MDERQCFVAEFETGLYTMTALCERYGVSRPTGYKFVERFTREGWAGLEDHSRRPQTSPRATAPEVIAALLTARRRKPGWGPKKLLPLLAARHPEVAWPAVSTASALLKRYGLIPPRRRRPIPGHPGRPTSVADAPNALWAIDFKGQFRTADGRWCYPLTLQDSYSRYLLACQGLAHPSGALTRAVLERVFRRFGLPARLRSDNGEPFASSYALARLSRLRVWFIRLGIHSELTEPAHPQQNGRLERLHRTLKADTARPAAATLPAQRRRFAHWRREYNAQRPHEALQQQPPARWYQPSARPYPARLPLLEYPEAALVLRVGRSGHVSWQGRHLSISHVLIGEDVAFFEIDDGLWAVYFGAALLGHFDERFWRLQPLPRIRPGRSVADATSRLNV